MNHGYRFDIENAKDREYRIRKQQKRQRLENRLERIKLHLRCHPRKIASIERLLDI